MVASSNSIFDSPTLKNAVLTNSESTISVLYAFLSNKASNTGSASLIEFTAIPICSIFLIPYLLL